MCYYSRNVLSSRSAMKMLKCDISVGIIQGTAIIFAVCYVFTSVCEPNYSLYDNICSPN